MSEIQRNRIEPVPQQFESEGIMQRALVVASIAGYYVLEALATAPEMFTKTQQNR